MTVCVGSAVADALPQFATCVLVVGYPKVEHPLGTRATHCIDSPHALQYCVEQRPFAEFPGALAKVEAGPRGYGNEIDRTSFELVDFVCKHRESVRLSDGIVAGDVEIP